MPQEPQPTRPGSSSARRPLRALLLSLTLLAGCGALFGAFATARSEASVACPADDPGWRPILKDAAFAEAGGRGDLLRGDMLEEWHARVAYDRVWRRVAPLLGSAGLAPPRMRFLSGSEQKPSERAAMWVGPDEAGCRTIFITPGQRRALGKQEGNWRSRAAALTRTLHETAHYFQSDEMLRDIQGRELGASRWASAQGPAVLGTAKRDRPVEFVAWRDRDQFGANYGGDPQTFGWPGLSQKLFASGHR